MGQRILFICGSMNQTTQMHEVSRHLTEYERAFTPFYCDGVLEAMRRLKEGNVATPAAVAAA